MVEDPLRGHVGRFLSSGGGQCLGRQARTVGVGTHGGAGTAEGTVLALDLLQPVGPELGGLGGALDPLLTRGEQGLDRHPGGVGVQHGGFGLVTGGCRGAELVRGQAEPTFRALLTEQEVHDLLWHAAAAYQSQDTEGLTEGVAVVGPGLAVADTSFLRTGLGATNQLEGLGPHVVSTEVGGVALADHGRVEELGRGPSDANFGVTSPVVVTVVAAHVVRDGGGDTFGGLGVGASGFQGDESVDGDAPVGHVTDRSGKSAVDEFSGQPLGGGGRSPRMSGFGGHGGGGEEAGDADTGQDECGKSSGDTDHEGSFETSPRCGARPGPDTRGVRIVPG